MQFMNVLCVALTLLSTGKQTVGHVNMALEGVAESRYEQSEIGCTAADAVRTAADADISIVNAGDIALGLPGRGLYEEDIEAVFSRDQQIAVAEISPSELRQMLEYACSHTELDRQEYIDAEASAWDGYAQVSGLSYTYDVTAPVGQRVTEIKVGGKKLSLTDSETSLTLAASDDMLSGGYGYPVTDHNKIGVTCTQALSQAVSTSELAAAEEERIHIVGCREDRIAGRFGARTIAAVMILAIAIILIWKKSLLTIQSAA